jgi:hypothetical protein
MVAAAEGHVAAGDFILQEADMVPGIMVLLER